LHGLLGLAAHGTPHRATDLPLRDESRLLLGHLGRDLGPLCLRELLVRRQLLLAVLVLFLLLDQLQYLTHARTESPEHLLGVARLVLGLELLRAVEGRRLDDRH
jgi:hypothetical protein